MLWWQISAAKKTLLNREGHTKKYWPPSSLLDSVCSICRTCWPNGENNKWPVLSAQKACNSCSFTVLIYEKGWDGGSVLVGDSSSLWMFPIKQCRKIIWKQKQSVWFRSVHCHIILTVLFFVYIENWKCGFHFGIICSPNYIKFNCLFEPQDSAVFQS